MATSYLEEIIVYPYKALTLISEDKKCVGLIRNKAFEQVSDADKDYVFEHNTFGYQYVDSTIQEADIFVWAEVDVPRVQNKQIKDLRLYITVACSKSYMKLDRKIFPGQLGSRRDTLIVYIDNLLSFNSDFGIGALTLRSVKTLSGSDKFAIKELEYEIPDFNYRKLK